MRDADVRAALHAKVLSEHHGEPDTLVLDELALWYGAARVDIAVVNARFHGFEIKSDRDTLDRLPNQMLIYNAILDRVTIVVAHSHLVGVTSMVPDWWGIKVVGKGPRGGVHFEEERAPRMNPTIDPVALASVLWNEELIEILEERGGAARGVRGRSRDIISRRVAEIVPLTDLRAEVRRRLKARGDWRADGKPGRYDGSSRRRAR